MNLGLHVIKNPAGTYSLVGSAPGALHDFAEPNRADILGQRVIMDGPNKGLVPKARTYQSEKDALDACAKLNA